MKQDPCPNSTRTVAAKTANTGIDEIASSTLFNDKSEVVIRHLGVPYRLRQTRNGKLLLYK
ncbi:MAG: hemin uptake protein HemP [Nevskiales bacterium]